jgi:hypothetical protein
VTLTWRRLGYLGFMIPFALWGLAAVIFGHMNFAAFRVAFLVAAVVVWMVGTRLNGSETDDDGKAMHLTFGMPTQVAGVLVSGACLILTFL